MSALPRFYIDTRMYVRSTRTSVVREARRVSAVATADDGAHRLIRTEVVGTLDVEQAAEF